MNELLISIPKNLENLQLPDPDLLTRYQDIESRVVWLEGEIDSNTLEILKVIYRYNKEDKDIPVEERKPIKIFIDSEGGDVAVMWSIIEAIRISKTPVYTINYCSAMSAASHILACGKKRFAFPGSVTLIHTGSATYSGDSEKVESAKKYFDSLSKTVNDRLLQNTKIDPKVLKKKSSFDWYITDTEALELGIVDKIVDDLDEVM